VKPDGALPAIRALHDQVDARAGELALYHADRLHCAHGCYACCVDDLTVFSIEAERIRAAHPDLLKNGIPHPPGACAFLGDQGECRVYDDRPYVCRTQGLPLRWLSENATGEIDESRDICPLNAEGVPLEAISEEDCWLIGPVEIQLGNLQTELGDPHNDRIALRSLFARSR
jgi:Fe-S-cluster containining protein